MLISHVELLKRKDLPPRRLSQRRDGLSFFLSFLLSVFLLIVMYLRNRWPYSLCFHFSKPFLLVLPVFFSLNMLSPLLSASCPQRSVAGEVSPRDQQSVQRYLDSQHILSNIYTLYRADLLATAETLPCLEGTLSLFSGQTGKWETQLVHPSRKKAIWVIAAINVINSHSQQDIFEDPTKLCYSSFFV